MPIANIKAKLVSLANQPGNDNSITKRLEVLSAGFKSTPTIIARDLQIEGILTSKGVIEIEGGVKGTINGSSVILREESFVEGTIIADSLSIRGKFEGKIKAKYLSILSRAHVNGEIEYECLSVEDGADIDGQFRKCSVSS
ncbi:MAG: polymer-forming cytoskeletal protein [Alphaproteobacteria bacterium]|nr:polymer-forming cytoskeletal protein [Alphaproteobacteria bacterium]